MASEFDRSRMKMQDRLVRDHRLSPSARLVGILLLSLIHREKGYAWPKSETLATTLGLSVRTVKNSTAKLERFGYFTIKRNVGGRSNHFYPLLSGANFAFVSIAERGAEIATEVGKDTRDGDAKNVPLSPLMTPSKTSLTDFSSPIGPNCTTAGIRPKKSDESRRQRGDEEVERDVSKALGPDGDEVLGSLHSIEGGKPYYELIAKGRRGEIHQRDLHAARLRAQHSRNSGGDATAAGEASIGN